MRSKGFRVAVLGILATCSDAPTQVRAPGTIRPQTVALLATPKMIRDFDAPAADVAAFLDSYAPLISRAKETIVIFAVGNSDHILMYRGTAYWSDAVEWANRTDFVKDDLRTLTVAQVANIVQAFKARADTLGIEVKIYDQVDSGTEFAVNIWKEIRHKECMDSLYHSFDIRAVLRADQDAYATAPGGAAAGMECGVFLVDQASQYLTDLGFDGILYGNQMGTRGRWVPGNGPGYTSQEAAAILDFFAYSREKYGSKDLMWFDSYNNTGIERSVWSVPSEAYSLMSSIMVAGFCVVTFPERYGDNLASKLAIAGRPPVFASLDYVDPWYSYDSMVAYPAESHQLEVAAINKRDQIDGIFFFANDERGQAVPRAVIESFAQRFFVDGIVQ